MSREGGQPLPMLKDLTFHFLTMFGWLAAACGPSLLSTLNSLPERSLPRKWQSDVVSTKPLLWATQRQNCLYILTAFVQCHKGTASLSPGLSDQKGRM